MARRTINPDGVVDSTEIGYSQAVVDGDRLYVSGQPGWDENNEVQGDDVATQTHQAFDNLATILAEVDRGLDDIAKVTCYLVNPQADLEPFLGVWAERLSEPRPCNTLVGVPALALEEFLVELDAEVPLD